MKVKVLILMSLFLLDFGMSKAENKIRVGAMTGIDNIDATFKAFREAGLESCEINYRVGKMTDAVAEEIKKASKKHDIDVTTIVFVPGRCVWNFKEGPSTIGLVPREGREEKIKILKDMIDFCVKAEVPAMHSHFGFIPEDMHAPEYVEFIGVMKGLAEYAKSKGIVIYFETGQETPITLIRAIKDIGTGNLFINCDLANLVMYGKANALDAVRMFGPLIKEIHAKDGLYPTADNPYDLGREVNIPEGEVDFPGVVKELKKQGFKGSLTIEREFGDNQLEYLKRTAKYLYSLINAED